MLTEIIEQAERSLVSKRNDLRYKRAEMMENIIKSSNSKLDAYIFLKYLMETTISQSNTIYNEVAIFGKSFNEACITAGI